MATERNTATVETTEIEQSQEPIAAPMVTAGRGRAFNLMPTTYKEAREFAELLAYSDMVPKDYREKPGNVLVAIMMGSEIGLPPLAAVQNIAVINGRPSLWGDGLLAVALAHPECEDVREHFERGQGDEAIMAVCTVLRRGREPVVSTFSVADAKKAGLWGKGGPWTQHPKRMLKMRARAFAIRDAFADALKGMGSAEEQADTAASVVTATVVRRTGGNSDLRALAGDVPEASAADKAAAVQDHDPVTGEVHAHDDAPHPVEQAQPRKPVTLADAARRVATGTSLTIPQKRALFDRLKGLELGTCALNDDALKTEIPKAVEAWADDTHGLDEFRDLVEAAKDAS